MVVKALAVLMNRSCWALSQGHFYCLFFKKEEREERWEPKFVKRGCSSISTLSCGPSPSLSALLWAPSAAPVTLPGCPVLQALCRGCVAAGMCCCCNAAAFRPLHAITEKESVEAVHSFHFKLSRNAVEVWTAIRIKILSRISAKLQTFFFFPFVFLYYGYI